MESVTLTKTQLIDLIFANMENIKQDKKNNEKTRLDIEHYSRFYLASPTINIKL